MNRRGFLRALFVGAATIVAHPLLSLQEAHVAYAFPSTTVRELDLAFVNRLLKEHYLPIIREQMNNSSVLMSRLEKKTLTLVGRSFQVPIHVNRGRAGAIYD